MIATVSAVEVEEAPDSTIADVAAIAPAFDVVDAPVIVGCTIGMVV